MERRVGVGKKIESILNRMKIDIYSDWKEKENTQRITESGVRGTDMIMQVWGTTREASRQLPDSRSATRRRGTAPERAHQHSWLKKKRNSECHPFNNAVEKKAPAQLSSLTATHWREK